MSNEVRTQSRRLGDIDVSFAHTGRGRNVVMIHGLGQDHGIWDEVLRHLGSVSGFAYDLRGHGGSSLGAADGTIEQLGGDLVAFLEFVGPATCIGFSLGGSVALWAAAERPDLVEGVIAVATSSVVGRAALNAMLERVEVIERGGREEVRRFLFDDTVAQVATAQIDAEAIVESRLEAISDIRGYVNGIKAICSINARPLNERLEQIRQPVLVINGDLDVWCPRRAAEIMLEHLHDASFIELRGVGHLVTDVAPQQLVETISRWMEVEGSK